MTESKKLAVLGTWPDAYADESPLYGWRVFSTPVNHPYNTKRLGIGSSEDAAWNDAYSRLPVEARESPFVPEGGTCQTCGQVSLHGYFCPNDGLRYAEKAVGDEPLCNICHKKNCGCNKFGQWNSPATKPAQEESQQEWKNYTASHLSAQCPKLRAYLDLRDAELDASQRENARLKNSSYVHIKILPGEIALTKAQAIHIAGLPADIEEEVERLKGERDSWAGIAGKNAGTIDLLQTAISKAVGILKAYAMDEHVERVVAVLTKTQELEERGER